jgi:hypothetical protein
MKLASFPAAFILSVIWTIFKYTEVDTSIGETMGMILIVLTIIAMLFEFYKSADLSLRAFAIDNAFAVAQLILCTITMKEFFPDNITLTDVVLYVCILADALLSPMNTVRTVGRDIIGPEHHDGHHRKD